MALACLGFSALSAHAATHLTGVVHTKLRPLSGVHVVVPSVAVFATTDSAGRFTLGPLVPGVHELSLVAAGSVTVVFIVA